MISIKNRIKKHADFQTVIHNKKIIKNEMYIVYVMKNEHRYGRIGISVSKKIGNAVARNWIKRQVRAIVKKSFDFTCDLDVVIIVRNKYQPKDYSLCQTNLQELLVKIRRMNDEKRI